MNKRNRRAMSLHDRLVNEGFGVDTIILKEGGGFGVRLTSGDQAAAEASIAAALLEDSPMTLDEAILRVALGQTNAAARAIVVAEAQRLAEERA